MVQGQIHNNSVQIAEDFLLFVYFATKYMREKSTSYTSLYKKTPKSQSMAQYLAPRIVP